MEAVLRFFGYSNFIYNFENPRLNITGYFLIADKFLGFKNRPNGRYFYTAIEGSPLVTTDNSGNRTTFSYGSNVDGPYIIFVGDSTVFCAEVNDWETGPSEVVKILKNQGIAANVINAGVRGYNTLQSKRMMELILNKINNIRMVIYVYCDNDFVENLNPIANFPMQAPTVCIDKQSGKKLEIDVQTQIVPWGEGFDTPSPPRNTLLKKFLVYTKSALLCHSYRLIWRIYNNFNNKENSKVLEAGWVGPMVTDSQWEKQLLLAKKNCGEELLTQLLIEMNSLCLEKRIKFISTRFTTTEKIFDDNYYKYICQKANVEFVSLIKQFQKDDKFYLPKMAMTPCYDSHYNQKGTHAFAQGLLPKITSSLNHK
jgi:hypothetical protein